MRLHLCAIIAGANPYLDEGRRLFDSLHFPEAEAQLNLARSLPTNTPEERFEAFDLLARALAAQGQMDQAQNAYAELLATDPYASEPRAAPKIRALFLKAKEQVYPHGYVRLAVEPAPSGQVSVRVTDPWGLVAQVELGEETSGRHLHRPLPIVDHRASGPLAASGEVVTAFEVIAKDQTGQAVAQLGPWAVQQSVAAPKPTLPPEPNVIAPAPPSTATAIESHPLPTWPKWIGGGISLTAALAGGALAVLSARDYAGAGRATAATTRHSLDLRSEDEAIAANLLVGGALLGGAATGWLLWKF